MVLACVSVKGAGGSARSSSKLIAVAALFSDVAVIVESWMGSDNANADSAPVSVHTPEIELREALIQIAPLVAELVEESGFYVPPTPHELGAKAPLRPAPECGHYHTVREVPCDGFQVFEPSSSARTRLCFSHLSKLTVGGVPAVRRWIRSLVDYSALGFPIDGQSLRLCHIAGTPLEPVNFAYGLNIRDSDFSGAQFSNCVLQGVWFEGNTRLNSARFRQCDLRNARFRPQQEFQNVEFVECQLAGALIKSTSVASKLLLRKGSWNSARFEDLRLDDCVLDDVDWANVELDNVTVRNMRVFNGDWNHVRFEGETTFQDCVFKDTQLQNIPLGDGVVFVDTVMDRCTFSRDAKPLLEEAEATGRIKLREPSYADAPVKEACLLRLPSVVADEQRRAALQLIELLTPETCAWIEGERPREAVWANRATRRPNAGDALIAGLGAAAIVACITEVLEIPYAFPIGLGSGIIGSLSALWASAGPKGLASSKEFPLVELR